MFKQKENRTMMSLGIKNNTHQIFGIRFPCAKLTKKYWQEGCKNERRKIFTYLNLNNRRRLKKEI